MAMAARWPYPDGSLWDDALFHARLIDEATGHPADLVDQLAVGELTVEVLDGRMAGPPFRMLDHHGQKVGAHGVVLPVGDGWVPRTSWPGSSPVGSPPSKVTAPRFTVQR